MLCGLSLSCCSTQCISWSDLNGYPWCEGAVHGGRQLLQPVLHQADLSCLPSDLLEVNLGPLQRNSAEKQYKCVLQWPTSHQLPRCMQTQLFCCKNIASAKACQGIVKHTAACVMSASNSKGGLSIWHALHSCELQQRMQGAHSA